MLRKSTPKSNGVFVVVEGTDGSGKATQCQLLADRLKSEGYDVEVFDFPRYSQPSSYFVQQYLNSKYGDINEVGPYSGSLFFALDRYDIARDIRTALENNKIVVANRFTASSMAHQGTKFAHVEERRGFFIWLDNLEFELLGIPRPDVNFVLNVPATIAQQLVDTKEARKYTNKKRDLHEADLQHLTKSVEIYDDLCKLFPRDFQQIDCVRDGKIMDRKDIHTLLWGKVAPLLPKPQPKPSSLSKKVANPYVAQTEVGLKVTKLGETFLQEIVTNTEDDVYALTATLPPATAAAAMARLCRCGDDLRLTILNEFAHAESKDKELLQRVITAYGDDSVQQLVGQYIVVENASNLLTKKLEWGRLAAYLEQSTRYIYFDKKDSQGKYKYYTPDNFDTKTRTLYEEGMNSIFELYSEMVHRLNDHIQKHSTVPAETKDAAWRNATRAQACDAVRPVLPVATQSTVGIFASGQAIENLILHLLSDELIEAQRTGEKVLKEARKTMSAFLERVDKPERGGAHIAYRARTHKAVEDLAKELLPENHTITLEAVRMTDVWPRNELDVVADMLYEHSNLSLEEIRAEVEKMTYKQKLKVVQTYIGERLNRRHKPGRALEKIHYSFDLVSDYGIFRDLQRHRMVDDLEWQRLTPRYGYEVPQLVDKAGLSDLFERCFDISLELYSHLQAAGYSLEAQYTTLLGHKMRWKVTYNAREAFHIHELRTSPQGHPGYRKLVQQMHETVAQAHPLIAESMKFVNKGEDPELTRLAAEKYAQFKVEQRNT